VKWILPLALIACGSHATICSGSGQTTACAEASQQLINAVSGNQGCNTDSDCVMVNAPTCDGSGFATGGFVAVSASAQAQVEHDFSVIQAENCAQCTSTASSSCGAVGGGGLFLAGTPTVSCIDAVCEISLVADAG
jgi:hypothetical protein